MIERKEVDAAVEARLDKIIAEIRKRLKAAKYDQRLPEGIVLVGGGARMRDIEKFAKSALEAAVKIGTPRGLGGVADAVEKPEFATAVGLAMLAANDNRYISTAGRKNKKKKQKIAKKTGILAKIFNKF